MLYSTGDARRVLVIVFYKFRALRQVADLVSRARDPEQIYKTAVDAVLVAANADRASILVFDDAGVMRFRAWHGLSDEYRAAVEGHSPWRPDDREPAPVLVPDVLADESLAPFRDVIVSEGIRALAFIPLTHQERLLGKFMLYYDSPHEFTEAELDAAGTVATQVAFALDRARDRAAIEELLAREQSARLEAEAANRAKDDFLAMLAHELRNPLSAIVNAVGILDRTSSQEPTPVLARALLRRQTDHLARLLDDLLDVARISRGRIDLRNEPLDFRAVFGLAVEAYRHRVEAKNLRLHIALPDEPVIVRGDAARLQQVVGNLLDNAAKYTPPEGAISLSVAIHDNQNVVLRIRDTGVGIPRERLASIFEPFTQLNTGLARAEGGLGIGLTLVKRLVELHGGSVNAASDGSGTGAEFTVQLPLSTEPMVRDDAPRVTGSSSTHIVLIEDNDDACEALATALRLDGHRVDTARTGAEGIAIVSAVGPDAVLVDIGLPDGNGFEVARQLREKLGSRFRLIALTGYGQPEDRKRSAEAGFDDHLVKPVTAENVARLLTP